MKIIYSQGMYNIFTDGIETFDKLPPRSYRVSWAKDTGFFLINADDAKNSEKVYGNLNTRADKVFKAYQATNRSVGVLMSGEKGIGKTMMARILCERANAMGLPVIIVTFNQPGIANFLGSIKQPALILFDEFEKMFGAGGSGRNSRSGWDDSGNGDAGGQPEMLSLLDGLYSNKWLFVFTCNQEKSISNYILGRPGRVHYHFRFNRPNAEEIEEYLRDAIPQEKYSQIPLVIAHSNYAKINYDALRAIAFEFNLGGDFKEFIGDLNIESLAGRGDCDIFVEFNDGNVAWANGCTMNIVNGGNLHRFSFVAVRDDGGDHDRVVSIGIDDSDVIPSPDGDGTYVIDEEAFAGIHVVPCPAYDDWTDRVSEIIKSGVKRIVIIPEYITGLDDIRNGWLEKVTRYHVDRKTHDAFLDGMDPAEESPISRYCAS